MLTTTWLILKTEFRLRLRHSHEWLYPLGFFITVTSIFPFAFTPDVSFLQKYMPGCIWIAALLSSLLSIESVFSSDTEDGHLEQLLLSPFPLPISILLKLIAHWFITVLPLIFLVPLLGWLFHLSISVISMLFLTLLFGTPILILIGSLGVALTFGLRQSGVLLGLLTLPLVTPVLIFGVTIVQQHQAGFFISGPLAFLAGLSLLAITLVPFAIAASLRIGIDE